MWTDDFIRLVRETTLAQSYFEEAIFLKQQHLPKHIYKYRRDDDAYAVRNLQDGTIWLASPDSYNDPYDCMLRFSAPTMTAAFERALIDAFVTSYKLQIPVEKIEEAKNDAAPLKALGTHMIAAGTPGENAKQMAELMTGAIPNYVQSTVDLLQALRLKMKVCSFSAIYESILMWSHYGNQHRGFCVEYRLEEFDRDDAFLRNLYPVIYSHELLDLTSWAERLVTGDRQQFNEMFPLLGVIQKFEGWAYEQEWRYVSIQDKAPKDRLRNMRTPSRLFLGARAPTETVQQIKGICAARKIPLWQLQMSNESYELVASSLA